MKSVASRSYSQRMKNGFSIALWIFKHNPTVFDSLDSHTKTILCEMLNAQTNQKLGRPFKFKYVITSIQETLLVDINDVNHDARGLLPERLCRDGLALVRKGFVCMVPSDKEPFEFKLELTPLGEDFLFNR